MNDITQITAQEIDLLFKGEVSPDLILEILSKPGVIIDECEVDYDQFSQWWSYALEGLIEHEPQTPSGGLPIRPIMFGGRLSLEPLTIGVLPKIQMRMMNYDT